MHAHVFDNIHGPNECPKALPLQDSVCATSLKLSVVSVNASLDKQLAIGHNAAGLQNTVLGMLTVCLSGNPFR